MSNTFKLLASTSYITVNKPLAKELGLYESIILGELISEFIYWEEREGLEDGMFFSTIENLEEQTTLSEHIQRTALKHLQNENLLQVKVKGLPAKRYIKLNVEGIEERLENVLNTKDVKNNSSKDLRTSSENFKELEVKNLEGNNNNINNNNIKNNNILEGSKEPEDFKTIIEYLNLKANKNYRINKESTNKFLRARFNEGYTVEDFKKVIDIKCSEWKDTDMDKYLRPETLFGNKFETYLNQKANHFKSGTYEVNKQSFEHNTKIEVSNEEY